MVALGSTITPLDLAERLIVSFFADVENKARVRTGYFTGDLHHFNAVAFGGDDAAPEHRHLFGFHIAHVMTFMAGLFG